MNTNINEIHLQIEGLFYNVFISSINKVLISVCLCDHNSGTPLTICLKFWWWWRWGVPPKWWCWKEQSHILDSSGSGCFSTELLPVDPVPLLWRRTDDCIPPCKMEIWPAWCEVEVTPFVWNWEWETRTLVEVLRVYMKGGRVERDDWEIRLSHRDPVPYWRGDFDLALGGPS